MEVRCAVSYVPFEARMDKVSFELMLIKTQPKQLIAFNTARNKAEKIKEFCDNN